MFHTVPAAEAFSIPVLRALGRGHGPEYTITGIVCTDCSVLGRQVFGVPGLQVRHASVDHVRFCAEVRADEAAEDEYALWDVEMDKEAERRTERYFEDRGFDDAREQEAFDARYTCPW